MTAIEERARELGWISIAEFEKKEKVAKEFAKQLERRKKGLQTAIRMKQKGCELAFIAEMTEIPEEKLKRFLSKWQKIVPIQKENSQ